MEISYKETINLPNTTFPMKGDLTVKEPQIIKSWNEKKIYSRMVENNSKLGVFTLPDGPPYANGDIHIGHVLNKSLKDFVIKYKNMSGYSAPFIPCFDCHGLPIEHKVTKNLGPKRKDYSAKDIRQMCRDEANKWIKIQSEQFERIGVLAEWEKPFKTIDPVYEAEEVRELARMYRRGVLYRGEKPVYWCWALQTALAEAEVEYHDHKSPSIYVKFYIKEGEKTPFGKFSKPAAFVIWTTTPWTLPANLAISLHPDFEYGAYDTGKEILILAKELQEAMSKDTELQLSTKNFVRGKELEGIKTQHPFIKRDSPIILGNHVTADAGTGAVHTAPGHGQIDYVVGLKYGLPVLSPVDDFGKYTDGFAEMKGTFIFDANPIIVEKLRASGNLLGYKDITHSYPHCWRSKTPLIFRATPQWFIRMDDENFNVRKEALKAIKDVKFVPEWSVNRLTSMVEGRPDWCLSRQRMWGVPIPVFYCEKCKEAHFSAEMMDQVANSMEEAGGMEAYFEGKISDLVGDLKCKKCGHGEFKKGLDILDVWFDSGVMHSALQRRTDQLKFPADIYLEGSDQHRGWFQTSLLTSVAAHGGSPFKALVTHGFVNDIQGKKMSKSQGNVVNPQDWIKKSGAEILRLFGAYEDYTQDLTCGEELFVRLLEAYRRFRNTMRFLLGNISDFDPNRDYIEYKKLMPLDRWAMGQLTELLKTCTAGYESYEFHKVYHGLNQFFTVDLSATYLDILKDRLYTWKKDGSERRSAQTVLYELTSHLIRIMAPITSFLSEESLQHMTSWKGGDKPESIFLTEFPKVNSQWQDSSLHADFEEIVRVRGDVSKNLEELRKNKTIGASLEAKVTVTCDGKTKEVLEKYKEHLKEYFIVSKVNIASGTYGIQSAKADGEKCQRCWVYDTLTPANHKTPGICPKCVRALS